MSKPKRIMLLGAVFSCLLLLSIPQAIAVPTPEAQQQGDVFLFIYGGFGLHFTIINDSNETIQAHYAIYGEGLYVNKTWERHGDFTAGPGVWTSAPPTIVPFGVMPITAFLYTNSGDMLQRSGISIYGFVLLVM